MPKKETIAIIGANSFLARNFISTIDREKFSLKLYDISNCQQDSFGDYEQIDLSSMESVAHIDFSSSLLYCFSGLTGTKVGFERYADFIDVNEKYFLNILTEYVNRKSNAKIIYPSTRLVYKSSKIKVSEDSEKEFRSIYAINKFASEKYLELYHETFNLQYCVLRICVPYGTLIDNLGSYGTYEFFVNQAQNGNITLYGDGSSRRTFTHINDICRVMLDGGLNAKCINDVYNVGGDDKSLLDVATILAAKYNATIEFVEWPEMDKKIEVSNVVFDDSKLASILNMNYKKIE